MTKRLLEKFDRARHGAMSIADLAVSFERIVGEPPAKKNKPWMLKRMEQAASSRAAVERAAARVRGGGDGGDGSAAADADGAQSEAGAASITSDEGTASAATEPAAQEPTAVDAATPEPSAAEAPPHDAPAPEAVAPEPEAPETSGPEVAVPEATVPEVLADSATAEATSGPAGGDDRPLEVANDVAAATAASPAPGPDTEAADEERAAPEGGITRAGGAARRRYVPARFKGKTIEELHAMYLQTVGKPTKSVDVPYIAWKIGLTERKGAPDAAAPRRARRASAGRGEPKAVTLREYPDTLAALGGVCTRHQFRNRLDFFRRAAHHYLEHLGEGAAAAFFAEAAPSDPAAPAASPS